MLPEDGMARGKDRLDEVKCKIAARDQKTRFHPPRCGLSQVSKLHLKGGGGSGKPPDPFQFRNGLYTGGTVWPFPAFFIQERSTPKLRGSWEDVQPHVGTLLGCKPFKKSV